MGAMRAPARRRSAKEVGVVLLLIILLILLVGGTGLLAFLVKSFIAAGIVGIIALALLVWLLLGAGRSGPAY